MMIIKLDMSPFNFSVNQWKWFSPSGKYSEQRELA